MVHLKISRRVIIVQVCLPPFCSLSFSQEKKKRLYIWSILMSYDLNRYRRVIIVLVCLPSFCSLSQEKKKKSVKDYIWSTLISYDLLNGYKAEICLLYIIGITWGRLHMAGLHNIRPRNSLSFLFLCLPFVKTAWKPSWSSCWIALIIFYIELCFLL